MHDGDSGMVERADMFCNRTKGNILLGMMVPILFGFGESARFKPDLYIDEGYDLSEYGFEAIVLSIRGHSKGSIGILTASGYFFCGDLLINEDKQVSHPIIDNSTDYNSSIEKLRGLKLKTIYPGHGKPFPMDDFIKNNRIGE